MNALWCSVQIKLGPNLVLWQIRLVLSEAVPRRCLRLALKVNVFLQKNGRFFMIFDRTSWSTTVTKDPYCTYIYNIIIYTYRNYTVIIVISCLPGLYFVHRVLQSCVARHLPHQHIWNISTFSVIAQGSLMLCGYPLPSLNMAGVACQVKKCNLFSHSDTTSSKLATSPVSLLPWIHWAWEGIKEIQAATPQDYHTKGYQGPGGRLACFSRERLSEGFF